MIRTRRRGGKTFHKLMSLCAAVARSDIRDERQLHRRNCRRSSLVKASQPTGSLAEHGRGIVLGALAHFEDSTAPAAWADVTSSCVRWTTPVTAPGRRPTAVRSRPCRRWRCSRARRVACVAGLQVASELKIPPVGCTRGRRICGEPFPIATASRYGLRTTVNSSA